MSDDARLTALRRAGLKHLATHAATDAFLRRLTREQVRRFLMPPRRPVRNAARPGQGGHSDV